MIARSRPLILALSLSACLTLPGGAGALAKQTGEARSPAPAQTVQPPQADSAGQGQLEQDQAIVMEALDAFSRGGFPALGPHIAALTAVCAHAPDSYPRVERRGRQTVVRDLDIPPTSPPDNAGRNVVAEFNVYGAAYLLRGSYAVELRAAPQAIDILDAGLALQPDNVSLMSEKSQALSLLRRFDDMLTVSDQALAVTDYVSDFERARLLRSKGFALIELDRLDDAEDSYHQSLRLEPDNPTALRELAYIERLRAGGPKVAPGLSTPGAPTPSEAPPPMPLA